MPDHYGMNVALDNFWRQIVINAHQQRPVVITRCPEGPGVELAPVIGSPIIETRKLRIRRVITDFALQQAVFIGKPDAASHRDDKAAAFAQGETPHLFVEREHGVFRRG